MAKKFKRPEPEAVAQLDSVIERWHPDLWDTRVEVGLLFVHAVEVTLVTADGKQRPLEPTLTSGGYACAAITRIISTRMRAHGMPDVEILVDGDRWAGWSREKQDAILDHELEHIVVSKQVDSMGRPKLRLRGHDFQLGWFRSVAERHGEHSLEVEQAEDLVAKSKQVFFPFAETASRPRIVRSAAQVLAAARGAE